jgi:hypothetical protein
MFVQVIQSKGGDPGAIRDRMDVWVKELGPGADGWLGSTAGYGTDGSFVAVARFRDEESARANSDRTEQGEWWQATEALFSDPAVFHDYTNVKDWRGGGSDTAGFVQLIQGRSTDIKRMQELDDEMGGDAPGFRPDIIGGLTCWTDDGDFTQIVYFTSEEEARTGESQDLPEDMKAQMEEWGKLTEDVRFIDLKEPWMWSP